METADLMGRSMDVVQRVLGDVLDLLHSSTDDERAALRPEWTDLTSLVNTALTASGPMFERGSASLSQGVPSDVARRLYASAVLVDPPRLRRALDAVLASASGITPPGGVTQVTVDMTETDAPRRAASRRRRRQRTRRRAKTRKRRTNGSRWTSCCSPGSAPRRPARRLARTRRWRHGCGLRRARKTAARKPASSGPALRAAARARGPRIANELLRMLREPLHRAAGEERGTRRVGVRTDSDAAGADERAAEAAFFGDAAATDDRVDRVFAPAAAALDLHVARMLAELHGGEILVRHVPSFYNPERERRHGHRHPRPALTRPMDNLTLERAQGAGEVPAAAGPWNNPFASRIPDSPAVMIRSRPPSRPLSRMATANQESIPAAEGAEGAVRSPRRLERRRAARTRVRR